MKKYVKQLVKMGFLLPNRDAEWQSAPHIVPEPNSKVRLRMTIDLRPVSSATTKTAWSMPHLDREMQDFSGSTCFACLEFCSGYWQLPLHPDSFSACGFICPDGVYSSTRVLQGLTNATAHFQSKVEPFFAELIANMKAWLDDFNLHSRDERTILALLERFFEICSEHNLILSAKKCVFFTNEIKWCGRVVNMDGFSMDQSKSEALAAIEKPQSAGELCEFIHCLHWMSISIPNFHERIEKLNEVLERAYDRAGRRTKRSIKDMQLRSLSWGTEHDRVFAELQDNLRNSIQLSHLDEYKCICVHTDALDKHWAGVVTQIAPKDLKKDRADQHHQPLDFVGGTCSKAEANWSTYE